MAEEGTVSFVEMGTGDKAKTVGFFSALFGWSFSPMDDNGNGWFDTPSGRIGLHVNDPGWEMVPFFKVTGLEAAMAKVEELGGQAESIAVAQSFGRFSNCKDPQGMRFGLHEPE